MIDNEDIQECVEEETANGTKLTGDELAGHCVDYLFEEKHGPVIIGTLSEIDPDKLSKVLADNGLTDEYNLCMKDQGDYVEFMKSQMEDTGMTPGLTDVGYEKISAEVCAEKVLDGVAPLGTVKQ